MKLEIEVFHWSSHQYCYCSTDYVTGRTRYSDTPQGAEEKVVADAVAAFRKFINSRKNPYRSVGRKFLEGTAARKIEIEV